MNYSTRADYASDFSGFAASGGIGKNFFLLHTLTEGKDMEQQVATPAETQDVRCSRDGKWIAVASLDASIQVHRTDEPPQNMWSLKGYRFSRDGRWLASGFLPPPTGYLSSTCARPLRTFSAAPGDP